MAIDKLFRSMKARLEGVLHSQDGEIDPRGLHTKCNSPVSIIKIHGDINV
jgi:hypothetical protein